MLEEKRKRNYSPEYKANAVKLAHQRNSIALAARELKTNWGYAYFSS
jgi:transposase-like protein